MSQRPRRPLRATVALRPLGLLLAPCVLATAPATEDAAASAAYVGLLGGTGLEQANATQLDDQGCLYVAGWTRSGDFPTTAESLDTTVAERDAFVAKVSADGESLVWSTVLGGSRDEEALTLLLDDEGVVLVGGWTTSDDFPTTADAHTRERQGQRDGFVAALDPNGGRLLASSFVGGSEDDAVTGVALTTNRDLLVTGWTESSDLPTLSGVAQRESGGGADAFLLRLDGAASRLRFATYLGGSADDRAVGVALDGDGYVLLAGTTESSDFPTSAGAFDRTHGSKDVFITRIAADGGQVLYSTYFGGSDDEVAHGFVLAGGGGAVVVGSTRSDDLPTAPHERDTRAGRLDGFVVHLSYTGGALVFSRYLGGSGNDVLADVAVDATGGLWVGGRTASDDLPVTASAPQPERAGGTDGLLAQLDPRTGGLRFATYVGGRGDEEVLGLGAGRYRGDVGLVGSAQRSDLDRRLGGPSRFGADSDVLVGRFVPGDCGVLAEVERVAAGTELRLDATVPRLGGQVVLTLSGAPPQAPGQLFIGERSGAALIYDGVGSIHLRPQTALVLTELTTDDEGVAAFALRVPGDPELCGLELALQALVVGRASDAVVLTIGG